jgi:hypothetical protein
LGHHVAHSVRVANITDDRASTGADYAPQIGFNRRLQGITCDLSAQIPQPKVHPRALESGVTGQQDFAVSPKIAFILISAAQYPFLFRPTVTRARERMTHCNLRLPACGYLCQRAASRVKSAT